MAKTLPALDIKKKVNYSPHVVILGAGASRACCLIGDANGKRLPLMDENFVKDVGLDIFLEKHEIEYKQIGFETLYSKLHAQRFENLTVLEALVNNHFSQFKLPDCPTVYDFLIMSLRDKDVIASFNWDPLLLQAYQRNSVLGNLPKLLFLHGNVSVGICEKDKVKGLRSNRCHKCFEDLTPTPLLFPVVNKDYKKSIFINDEWSNLNAHLGNAYMVTIFGYGAPESDTAAIEMMKNVWKNNTTKEFAEIEIIDIKSKDELLETWSDFIISHHYMIASNIRNSFLLKHPRRSCEAFAWATLQCDPWQENCLPNFNSLNEYHEWLKPHLEEERSLNEEFGGFSGNPIVK